jgi:uncharacterized protein YqeY
VSSSLKQRLQGDLVVARKSRDKLRTVVLSTALSEVRNREIELGREVVDDDVLKLITKAIKQRRDAAEMMRTGGREELAAREDDEAAMLGDYLPAALSEDEVRTLIHEIVAAGASDMGAVMSTLMPRLAGRFEGKEANRLVREEFAG